MAARDNYTTQPLTEQLEIGEFERYPWPGLMRALVYSFRRGLPSLRAFVLAQIEKLAREVER